MVELQKKKQQRRKELYDQQRTHLEEARKYNRGARKGKYSWSALKVLERKKHNSWYTRKRLIEVMYKRCGLAGDHPRLHLDSRTRKVPEPPKKLPTIKEATEEANFSSYAAARTCLFKYRQRGHILRHPSVPVPLTGRRVPKLDGIKDWLFEKLEEWKLHSLPA